jgi:hypothetical protein
MRIAIGVLAAGIAVSANASVIFSNLGTFDTFGTSGWVVGNRTTPFGSITLEVAASFTPDSDAVFTGADFAAELIGQPGDLNLALFTTGPEGTPGSALETFTAGAPISPSLVSVQSSLNPVLFAGTEYWLDITSSSTAAVWLDNVQGGTGPIAVNQNGQGFALLTGFGGSSLVQPAFRITGDPVGSPDTFAALADPAAVPEPSALLLVAVGLLLFRPLRMMGGTKMKADRRTYQAQ